MAPLDAAYFQLLFEQLLQSPYAPVLTRILYPNLSPQSLRERLLTVDSVDSFQQEVMYRASECVIQRSTTRFTFSGEEYLRHSGPSLFVSNHRDIVLDAMLLQYIQVRCRGATSHVVVGSNLFEMPLMAMLAEANKMYGIGRGGSPREYYKVLMDMSAQLRRWVTQQGESAWIAQRNGRTKDGRDRTDPALIKMIAASGDRTDPARSLAAMHIVPVSVSYEWEPCGWQKARETLLTRTQSGYAKQPGEDTESIVHGIKDPKGRVHFTICPPIEAGELEAVKGDSEAVATLLDRRISGRYRLWPNHYVAFDLLHGTDRYSGAYTAAERQAFEQYLDDACRHYPLGPDYRTELLRLYAAPLDSSKL